MNTSIADTLIVGAGLAGLMAAQALIERGERPLIVDKGRSTGGRLATRRVEGGLADHGAQFFTVRSPVFADWVKRWQAAGVVYPWGMGFSSGAEDAPRDGHPRYATHGGMNALARHLEGGLAGRADLRLNVTLKRLTPSVNGWEAVAVDGAVYATRRAILTAPVPQALALVGEALRAEDRAALERVAYAPCICGMFRVEGETRLPEPGALQRPEAGITWIADNQRKGISPGARIITVHAGPALSAALYDQPEAEALAALRAELEAWLAPGAAVVYGEYKRWRYAQPTILHPERMLVAGGVPPLAFAGDAFGEARVEGAALSGLAAAEALFAHPS